jgi:hypothetical protein
MVISPLSTTSGIVGNPTYSFNALVSEWNMGGGVGELSTMSVSWPITGAITKVAV